MSNWCEYWSNSRFIKISDSAFKLVNGEDYLDFYVDKRAGRTYGMIYLFSQPGTKGATIAHGEEASFLEGLIYGRK